MCEAKTDAIAAKGESLTRQALEHSASEKRAPPKAFSIDTKKLPCEQDRRCILGCLAVVLATGGTARFVKTQSKDQSDRVDSQVSALTLDEKERSQESEGTNLKQDSISVDSTQTFRTEDVRASRLRKRALAVRNDILRVSAQALVLDDSAYASFLPILSFSGAECDEDEIETIKAAMLRPFLESLGDGFSTMALLLTRHLLTSPSGYDARVRVAYRETAAEVLSFGLMRNNKEQGTSDTPTPEQYAEAVRKFEALEAAVAQYLIALAKQKENEREKRSSKQQQERSTKQSLVRAAKIGGAGVAAGALFAVTGGLAAPAIAAGIGTVTAGTAVAGSVAVLTSSAAVTTLFGVGGGLMAANKMQRRVTGLTDFTLVREREESDLHATICISGWLRDKLDFQRPWGVTPTELDDRLELLKRFYAVFRPDYVEKAPSILEEWSGRENELWSMLEDEYGRSPDSLLPIYGPMYDAALSSEEMDVLADLLQALGYMDTRLTIRGNTNPPALPPAYLEAKKEEDCMISSESSGQAEVKFEYGDGYSVWDFGSEFGGEQYTIEWEGGLLLQLCDAARKFAKKFLTRYATKEAIKYTTLQALMSAIALPATLLSAASYMDSDWTLATERADEAGVELAHLLLDKHSGDRPVTLVGYSLGARIVYSCLKELGRLQLEWEEAQDMVETDSMKSKASKATSEGEEESPLLKREPFSIVADAILLGLPYHENTATWEMCRQVVAGRLINCYVPKDLVLLYLFNVHRLSSKVFLPVCGTTPVNVPGVENYNIESIVTWHGDYCGALEEILRYVKFGQPRNIARAYIIPEETTMNEGNEPDPSDVANQDD